MTALATSGSDKGALVPRVANLQPKDLSLMMNSTDQSLVQRFSGFPTVDVDLQGGTLIDVKRYEEVDESDGCLVRVSEFHILSADKKEELIKTCRQKLKIECNQISKRTELVNGKEAKVQETSQRMIGDIKGFRPPTITGDTEELMLEDDDQDVALGVIFSQTHENFLNMISEQRNQLIQMFPDLFSEMRTESQLLPPLSTEVETIVNPDGSKTTRIHSSRAYSSRISKEEMYINGVKQESKSKFRAFMEYKGPEGGFVVNLSDNQDELSEEEGEEKSDIASQISEIPEDAVSDFVSMSTLGRGPKLSPDKSKKRMQKAWHAAKELVDSEQRYVDKLKLLSEIFMKRVVNEHAIEKNKILLLFSNVNSLYEFHEDHLLPALMEGCRDWHSTHRISNVLKKRAPFLKMYSEYTHNYKTATKVFDECMKKKRKFLQIVREIERLPECENLPLVSHLICPVQRVMRYQLLLQEYQKHLTPHDPDYEDTQCALSLVLEAASHANEMMRKLDRYKNVLEIQEQMGNTVSLVSPSRELLKEGKIFKISSSSDRVEERLLFVFNDMLLLVSERAIPGFGKYKLRALFDAVYTQVCEGDNLEMENSFYIRGSDSQNGPSRCIELFVDSQKEKLDWINTIWNVIRESLSRKSFTASASNSETHSVASVNLSNRRCLSCQSRFTIFSRGTTCAKCAGRYCKKCFGKLRTMSKSRRVCSICISNSKSFESLKSPRMDARVDALDVPADTEDILYASYVTFKGSQGKVMDRYFAVRKNFCLYSYKSNTDLRALAMLPLPGCVVKLSGEKLSFTIKHSDRSYSVTVADEKCQIRWMAVLDLASNASFKPS
uniref:FYVE, RhoGEF and PH domain-containing protein 6 n=1 Tax=Syphacia muris TaxID=451379 RepID=A0A158R5L5_9BILA